MKKIFWMITMVAVVVLTALEPIAGANEETRILGKLYEDGHPETGEGGEVVDMAGWGHFLYVSRRDLDGDQYIDLWDVIDPSSPEYIRSYSFGNIFDDSDRLLPVAHLKVPKNMKVVDGHLVFWSEFEIHTYRLAGNGELEFVAKTALADERNENLLPLSHGGNYASTERRLLNNDEVLDLLSDAGWRMSQIEDILTREVFINLSDPTKPYVMMAPRSPGAQVLESEYPISGTYEGFPAVIHTDGEAFRLTFEKYSHQLDRHLADFWGEKIWHIFNANAAGLSMGEIYEQIIRELDVRGLQGRITSEFLADLELDDAATIRSIITGRYGADLNLSRLLSDHGIGLNDSMDTALDKIIESYVATELERRISTEIFPELLQHWRNKVFSFNGVQMDELKRSLKAAMDAEISDRGLVEYFVKKIVAPMLNNPDFINLTMNDLVNGISASPAGRTVDGALRVFHGAMLFDYIGFDAPGCFNIPRTSKGLLEKVLYNDGIDLNPNGLAFWEVIKMGQYYAGNDSYLDFDTELAEMIDDYHSELVDELFRSLFSAINSNIVGAVDLDEFIAAYSGDLKIDKAIVMPLREAIKKVLRGAGLNTNVGVRTFLNGLDLYTELAGLPEDGAIATVRDFVETLEAKEIAQYSIGTLFNEAGGITFTPLEEVFRTALTQLGGEIFGHYSLETSLQDVVNVFIATHVNGGAGLKGLLSGVMNRLLSSSARNVFITGWLNQAARAANGDCVAQWQMGIRSAILFAKSFGPAGDPFVAAFVTADAALAEAYNEAIDFLVSQMVSRLAGEIFLDASQSYESWYSKLAKETMLFELRGLASFEPEHMNAFIWKDMIYVVLRNVDLLGPEDFAEETGQVSILVFDPKDPAGSAREISLGRWETMNGIIQEDQYIALGGTVLVNGQSTSNLMIVDLENGLSRPMEFQGRDALFLIVPKHMEIINGGSNMAVGGADDRIDILYVPLTKDLAHNNVGRANDGVGGDVGADDGVGDDGANGGGHAFDAPSNQDQAGQGSSGCSMINAHHADGNVSLFIMMMTLIGLFASFRLGRRIRPRRLI